MDYEIEQKCFIEEEDCHCFECLKSIYKAAQYFDYRHLPPHLQEVSKQFYNLMAWILMNTPECEQRYLSILKLLETKDCAVRAALTKEEL